MKKNYFSIIFLLAFTSLNAQITLNQADIQPSVGDYVDVNYFNPTTNVVGPAGSGVVWDFNYLSIESGQDWNFGGGLTGVLSAAFPDANLTMSFLVGSFFNIRVYRTDGSGQYYQGVHLIGAGDVHQDDKLVVPYPLSFGETTSDAFSSIRNVTGARNERYGDVHFEVDGHGTLIMPNGVFEDVLRLKSVEIRTSVSEHTFPQSVDYDSTLSTITTYQWFKGGIHHPLLTITEFEDYNFVTGLSTYSLDGSFIEEFILSDDELEAQKINAAVYPNPVVNVLNLTTAMEDPEQTTLTIFNLLGEEVQSQALGMMGAAKQSAAIDVSSLDAGVYLARIETTSGASQAIKFIKQ